MGADDASDGGARGTYSVAGLAPRGGAGVADRMRERRQPVARSRSGAPARDRDPRGAGRGASADRAPVVARTRVDRVARRGIGAVVWRMGAQGAGALKPGQYSTLE